VARDIAIDFEQFRRTEMRRAMAISAAAHLVLLAMFLYAPAPTVSVPRGVVAVELVSMPAQSAKPASPAPARPEPVAKPKPAPKPKPKKVALPAEPTKPVEKPKPIAKPKPAPKPKPVAKPKPPVEPPPELGLDDVLAQLRAESGETAQPAVVAAAQPATGPVGVPTGVPVSPEVASWLKRAKIHVRRNWVLQPGFKTQMLEAEVRVDLDNSGAVRGVPSITKKSGNPWYDEGVVRAIQKSSPLPPPPEAGEWTFVFLPEDSF